MRDVIFRGGPLDGTAHNDVHDDANMFGAIRDKTADPKAVCHYRKTTAKEINLNVVWDVWEYQPGPLPNPPVIIAQPVWQRTPGFNQLSIINGPAVPEASSPKQLKVYIAGPMTGLPEFNYPAFFEAHRLLRNRGYEVVNPCELHTDLTLDWHQYLKVDIQHLATCDRICLLDGWQKSRGATLELFIATQIGIPAFELKDWRRAADD